MPKLRTAVTLFALSHMAVIPVGAQTSSAPQDRPFVFSVSTPRTDTRHATVHLDAGFGERPFDVVEGDRPEQRLGIQAYMGRGVTLLARVGIASDQRDMRSSQQGELLYSVLRSPANRGSLAVGFGMRRESAGINVLLGRVAAGRTFSAWRVDGNALFEKPYSAGRDPVDLITTIGVARQLFVPALHVGIEMIGEDLEGFWEPEEAEGGARLLIGPSIRVAPTASKWQLGIAGGRVAHATRSSGITDATRSLPSSSRDGYAVRASLSYGF
jgi:hypothetical protein